MDWIWDLLLPRTDLGVGIQVVVVLVGGSIVFWRLRSVREARLVVLGSGLVVLGLMGLRALH